MRHLPLITLALAACGDMDFRFSGLTADTPRPDTDEGDEDVDSDVPADTDAIVDTDEPEGTDCPDSWPDVAVSGGTCPEVDWTLVEVATSPPGTSALGTIVGRVIDDDGDGDVDDDDRPAIVSVVYDLPVDPYTTVYGAIYDADLAVYDLFAFAGYNPELLVGELEPGRDGVEFVAAQWSGAAAPWQASWYSPEYYEHTTFSTTWGQFGSRTWLTDIEGDGVPDLIADGRILDGTDGTALVHLQRDFAATAITSADLDLDGAEEILGIQCVKNGGCTPGYWTADGTWAASCPSADPYEDTSPGMAVGNLDGDPEGEFVVALYEELAICDTDGTLLATVPKTGSDAATVVAIGDLDGDGSPEIVLNDESRLVAYDRDLVQLWEWTAPIYWRSPPFLLADLDQDGSHEIVLHAADELLVLDGDGSTLASLTVSTSSWLRYPPKLVDLYGDGLSEIVLSGDGGLSVVSTATGGFDVAGAKDVWDHGIAFPGDRGPDATVNGTALEAPWESAETNVWAGLATSTGYTDLAVASAEICGLDCDGEATVAVYVSNTGAEVAEDVTVRLRAGDVVIAEATLSAALDAGVSRAVTLAVDAADLGASDLTVTVSGAADECDEADNALVLAPVDCP